MDSGTDSGTPCHSFVRDPSDAPRESPANTVSCCGWWCVAPVGVPRIAFSKDDGPDLRPSRRCAFPAGLRELLPASLLSHWLSLARTPLRALPSTVTPT